MPSPLARGFTLIEVMITISVIALIATIAVPSLSSFLENHRASGAAESILTFLHLARSESIKQMRPMVVTYATADGTQWRMGMRDATICEPTVNDPEDEAACSIIAGSERVLKTLDAEQFRDVGLTSSRSFTRFEPTRATSAGSNVTLRITTPSGREVRVIVANSGRIRACSPAGDRRLGGYAVC